MTCIKMWACYFRGKALAQTRNILTENLRQDAPDLEAIRAALPKRYQSMSLTLCLSHNDTPGEGCMRATVYLRGWSPRPLPQTITCRAYFLDPETGVQS